MAYLELKVHPELKDYIKCFWYIERTFSAENPVFQIMPDSYAELVFYYGAPISVRMNNEDSVLPNPFFVGLLSEPLSFRIVGTVQVFGVRTYAWAALPLLGWMPDSGINCDVASGYVILKAGIIGLASAGKIEEAMHGLNEYFLNKIREGCVEAALTNAGQLLSRERGDVRMNELEEHTNQTERTLQRLFKKVIGQSPKELARKIRFEFALNAIFNDPGIALAQLAYDLGYTDQAHFNHEFKQFSHKTPSEFAGECTKKKSS